MAKKSKKSSEIEGAEPASTETEVVATPETEAKPKAKKAAKRTKKAVDPIGDETDGEAAIALEAVAEPAPVVDEEAEIGTAPQKAKAAQNKAKAAQDKAVVALDTAEAAEDSAEAALQAADEFEAEAVPDQAEDESDSDEDEPEVSSKPRPPAKLERLQKILAQAGVASRRKAEEMIEQGRVQVNGKVVTALGTKADAGRDHIRVDGKLLHGAERLRYFVLNKPKGFVTTVKDPEGRPTVMQFFDKMRERLYPVGRLDYMSEGLLLVTNDGELANRLTRAAAGVEKTYLVKVAGVPSEAELDQLRAGVAIERGKPGSDKVRTSPARIRQVRQGDNPWYEVVLIEGRNRELRKMFEEVGHFVEKIRRVGYGPLVLDQEPGNLRELDENELTLLRKAADGTLRTPKSKEIRRRNAADKQLPTVAPKPSALRPARPSGARPSANKSFEERPALGPKDYRPKRAFEAGGGTERPGRPAGKDFGPARPAWKKDDRPSRPAPRFDAGASGESRPPAARPFTNRPAESRPYGAKPAAGRTFGSKPPATRPYGDKPAGRTFGPKPGQGREFPSKPAFKKPEGQQWPPYKRPPVDRPTGRPADRPAPPKRETHDDEFGPVRPPNLHIEEIKGADRTSTGRASTGRSGPPRPYADRPNAGRPSTSRPRPDRPQFNRPPSDRPRTDRPSFDRPSSDRPSFDRTGPRHSAPGRSSGGASGSGRSSSDRPSSARPFRSEGGLARPFTTSSGKPRAGGARPSSKPGSRPYSGAPKRGFDAKPGGPAKRPFRRDEGEGSFAPRPPRSDSGTGPRTGGKPGWKPKPSFGGKGKPGGGGSRPAFKSGPKSGGKRPGSFGKKRP